MNHYFALLVLTMGLPFNVQATVNSLGSCRTIHGATSDSIDLQKFIFGEIVQGDNSHSKSAPGRKVRARWSDKAFTDPEFHRQDKFRYRVHSINSVRLRENGRSVEEIYDFLTGAKAGINPQFSFTVIDQNHRRTFGSYGFIIKVAPSHLIATATNDIGSTRSSRLQIGSSRLQELWNSYYDKYGILGPEELLILSGKGYNEVVAKVSDSEQRGVQIIGIFRKRGPPDWETNWMEDKGWLEIEMLASRLQIPMIDIVDKF